MQIKAIMITDACADLRRYAFTYRLPPCAWCAVRGGLSELSEYDCISEMRARPANLRSAATHLQYRLSSTLTQNLTGLIYQTENCGVYYRRIQSIA